MWGRCYRAAPETTMAKKPVQDYSWRISRIRGTPAAEVGTVQAPDAEMAIQVAIEKYKITDPEKQKRLVAQRLR
jgi:1,2-phenylacetyl-CoA epoxidase PaaB subunit